jgi:hypothetical protein
MAQLGTMQRLLQLWCRVGWVAFFFPDAPTGRAANARCSDEWSSWWGDRDDDGSRVGKAETFIVDS